MGKNKCAIYNLYVDFCWNQIPRTPIGFKGISSPLKRCVAFFKVDQVCPIFYSSCLLLRLLLTGLVQLSDFHLVLVAPFSCLSFILFFNDNIFFTFRYQNSFRKDFMTHSLSASSSSSLETAEYPPSGPSELILLILSIHVTIFSTMISISYGSFDESPRLRDYRELIVLSIVNSGVKN